MTQENRKTLIFRSTLKRKQPHVPSARSVLVPSVVLSGLEGDRSRVKFCHLVDVVKAQL